MYIYILHTEQKLWTAYRAFISNINAINVYTTFPKKFLFHLLSKLGNHKKKSVLKPTSRTYKPILMFKCT